MRDTQPRFFKNEIRCPLRRHPHPFYQHKLWSTLWITDWRPRYVTDPYGKTAVDENQGMPFCTIFIKDTECHGDMLIGPSHSFGEP